MDILARRNLWTVGLDYKHGTGHGVGSYLNVHEGPQGISRANSCKLLEGMCVSDEPGFYKDGEFGIRIENVILCKKHPVYADQYCWENLTVAPYCRELIDTKFLSPFMINYINEFHEKVLKLLTPFLENEELALNYVKRQCAPL